MARSTTRNCLFLVNLQASEVLKFSFQPVDRLKVPEIEENDSITEIPNNKKDEDDVEDFVNFIYSDDEILTPEDAKEDLESLKKC